MNSDLTAVNDGFLLSTVICGRSVCGVSSSNCSFQGPIQQRGELDVEDIALAYSPKVYSAIAEAVSLNVVKIYCESSDDDPTIKIWWQWFAYAFVCRSVTNSVREVAVWNATITESYVSVVSAVLEHCYPEPMSELSSSTSEYGFVKIRQGTELQLLGSDGNDKTMVAVAHECECRELSDPSSKDHLKTVVPGYGICKLKTGNSNVFIRDKLPRLNFQTNSDRGIQALALYNTTVENDSVLVKMLMRIGQRLKVLMIHQKETGFINIDIGALATACPALKVAQFFFVNVAVSDSDGLRNWGIQNLEICKTNHLPRVLPCLENSEYRMSRELKRLHISRVDSFDVEYKAALSAHNGEFLPVAKEKFPVRSKAAMISVVAADSNKGFVDRKRKAIRYLDAMILHLVFEFAATPEQRSVQVLR